ATAWCSATARRRARGAVTRSPFLDARSASAPASPEQRRLRGEAASKVTPKRGWLRRLLRVVAPRRGVPASPEQRRLRGEAACRRRRSGVGCGAFSVSLPRVAASRHHLSSVACGARLLRTA